MGYRLTVEAPKVEGEVKIKVELLAAEKEYFK